MEFRFNLGQTCFRCTPICHVDQSNTNFLSAVGTYEDELATVEMGETKHYKHIFYVSKEFRCLGVVAH
jgi:hypothetical protein